MRIVCVIPARLKSTRFPKKMLAFLAGKPLLQRVWEAATAVPLFDEVVFAIDADETATLIESFGGDYLMTQETCQSGTDRLIEIHASGKISADIWVNWQGDEPFITAEMIGELLQSCHTEVSDIWTLKKKLVHEEEVTSPHIAKIVCDANNFALYCSRSAIPYYREACPASEKLFYKHIGLYAFTSEALQKIATLPPCYLEEAEKLEHLRFLFGGLKMKVHETSAEVIGIDLPEHLVKAEAHLQALLHVQGLYV